VKRTARLAAALTLGAVLGLSAVMVAGTPAYAHANLASTEPADGQTLAGSPTEVVLRFTDRVEIPEPGPRLYDSSGSVVATGKQVLDQSATELRVELPELADGTYVVTWRAVSGDGHPIRGAFTFNVGSASTGSAGLGDRLLSAQRSDRVVGALYAALRAVAFAALLVVVGTLGFAALITRGSERNPALLRVGIIALAVHSATAATTLIVIGPYVSGGDLGSVIGAEALADSIDSRLGRALVLRLGLGVIGLVAAVIVGRRRPSRVVGLSVACIWSVATVATFSWVGHPRTGRWRSVAPLVDLLHLLAAGVWIGGLVALVACTLRRGAPNRPDDPEVVRRFSTVATWCVATVVITGVAQSFRQLSVASDLWETTFGRLLLAKVAAVAVIVLFGTLSWSAVRRRAATTELRPSVFAETVISVVVVLLTAGLVNANPPRAIASSASPTPTLATATAKAYEFRVSSDPGRVGANTVTIVVVDRAEEPIELFELHATAQPSGGTIEPLELALEYDGGTYSGAAVFPFAGDYTIALRALTGPIDQVETAATITIT
jgi:copper transport protein